METVQFHPIDCTNSHQNKQKSFKHGTLRETDENKNSPKVPANSSYGYWSITFLLQYVTAVKETTVMEMALIDWKKFG